ncbi:MAG: EF-hand domain-containing protein [Pseudomonadota bacterium]
MSKKTESIEIRVSPELKAALAARARDEGRSMSDLVRALIDRPSGVGGTSATPTGEPKMILPSRSGIVKAAVLSLPIAALGIVYALSAQTTATASSHFRVIFAQLDANADGEVTSAELARFLELEEEFEPEPDCATTDEPCTALEEAELEIARHDSDGNAVITYEELEAYMLRERAAVFIEHDLNENGFVTAEEMALFRAFEMIEDGAAVPAACRALVEAEDPVGALEACGERDDILAEIRIEMAEADANRDGRVALLEFLTH